MERNLILVSCEEKYWEFIRLLRTDKNNLDGFIKSDEITPEQQKNYMKKYNSNYYVALLDNIPVGFIGEIDGDIRVCTAHQYKGKGIGKFMVKTLTSINPNIFAKVKIDNEVSKKLFESCGFKLKFVIYEPTI